MKSVIICALASLTCGAGGLAAYTSEDVRRGLVNARLTVHDLQAQEAADSAQTSSVADTTADSASAPQPAPVDQERARTDADIEGDLRAVFDRVPELAGITVSVEAGVVRLGGTVLTPQATTEAEDLARSFAGVLLVVNRVEASTSLRERLQPTWARLRDFSVGTMARGPLFLAALVIVGIAWLIGRWVRSWSLPAFLSNRNPFLQGLAQRMLQAMIVLGGVVVALQLLDAVAVVGALAGTAGLAGLTLGFAFKDIVENYLAGILLSVRHPFATNDHIVVDGQEGKVIRLTWRDTILMTLDGNHLRVPNAKVFGSTVLNYSRNPKRRFRFDFGVGPADDLLEAQRIGRETLLGMKSVLEDPPPQAIAMELGDSSVQVRFQAWVNQDEADLTKTRSEAIRLVKLALEEAGVDLPSPEYKVVMMSGGETPRSDREDAPPAAREPREEQDTSVDESVDQQILDDAPQTGEENLLLGGTR